MAIVNTFCTIFRKTIDLASVHLHFSVDEPKTLSALVTSGRDFPAGGVRVFPHRESEKGQIDNKKEIAVT